MSSDADGKYASLGDSVEPITSPHGRLICRMPFVDEFIDLVEVVKASTVKYAVYVQTEIGYFPFKSNSEAEFVRFDGEEELGSIRVDATNELIETINDASIPLVIGKTLEDMVKSGRAGKVM